MRSIGLELRGSTGLLLALQIVALLSVLAVTSAHAQTLYHSDGDPFGAASSSWQARDAWDIHSAGTSLSYDPRALLGLRWDRGAGTARQFGYRQSFFGDRFALSLGQSGKAPLDRFRFTADPPFQNPARSGGDAPGFAAMAEIRPNDSVYLRGGFNGPNAGAAFLQDAETGRDGVYRAELGVIRTIPGLGEGAFRVSRQLGPDLDAGGAGAGFSFSLEQQTPYNASAWLSAGSLAPSEGQGSRQFFGGGIVFDSPFGLEGDAFGLSLGWAESSDGGYGNGVLLESFWTFNLTDGMSFTPDVQLNADPAYGPEDPPVSTIGVLRFDLKF